ncbi:MAG: DUF4358 domain-containing protein [Oscillospiraceae bacterium]|jgi:hypothetical protein|nr:DUF4358 domain-containing protein [Oscillospiraceae bacterium]
MKQNKKIAVALLSLLLLGLAACGGGKTVDIKTLPEAILEKVTFGDQLSELDEGAIANLYTVPEGVTARVFLGSGATSEEIAVFQCPDAQTAKTMLENAKTHISDRITAFENYLPEQVQTLNDAIVEQIGNTVVVCVTKNVSAARQVIGA